MHASTHIFKVYPVFQFNLITFYVLFHNNHLLINLCDKLSMPRANTFEVN